MLWVILAAIVGAWWLGTLASVGGNFIHLLLLAAAVILIFEIVGGRRRLFGARVIGPAQKAGEAGRMQYCAGAEPLSAGQGSEVAKPSGPQQWRDGTVQFSPSNGIKLWPQFRSPNRPGLTPSPLWGGLGWGVILHGQWAVT
jgi:hypothetical protein